MLMSVLSLGASVLEFNAVVCASERACMMRLEMEGIGYSVCGLCMCTLHVCVCILIAGSSRDVALP